MMSEVSWGLVTITGNLCIRYSQIAKPLNNLISGENTKKKKAPVDWQKMSPGSF